MKRFAPFLWLLIPTIFGVLCGAGVNLVAARWIAPASVLAEPRLASTPLGDKEAAHPAPRTLSEATYLDGIRRRNIFDPAYIEAYNPQARAAAGGGVALSDLKLKLLATLVAKPDTYSSALIAAENGGAAGYGVHDHIRGTEAEIVTIEVDRVKIRGADGVESYLMMEQQAPPPSSSGDTTVASTDGATNDFGVEQLGENKYGISKEMLAKYLADPSQLAAMGRALLHRGPDGEYDGYRLSAIRKGTLPDALGIKTGDVIHSVNGQPLNSMQSAMNAGTALMGGSTGSYQIQVSRRGQDVTLEYEIH